jgi:hypothetical protein
MTVGWLVMLTQIGKRALPIHWIIAIIAGTSVFEHLICTVRYIWMNSSNTDSTGLFLMTALA